MRVAVLFDGAGLARLGLEQAGLDCTGVELNPIAHHLSTFVGSGNCVLADVRDVDLSGFEAVWASPPCQQRSAVRRGDPRTVRFGPYAEDLLSWALALPHPLLWVENVSVNRVSADAWGKKYNAAQFAWWPPRQSRLRIVGGRYPEPTAILPYRRSYPGICPCVTASEYKGDSRPAKGPKRGRHASRFYGRRLTLAEAAWHQGFEIPAGWQTPLPGFTPGRWQHELYRAIGNGVPVWMARAFGEAAARLEAVSA